MKDSQKFQLHFTGFVLVVPAFQFTESTCWIGSVGAEGDSGCEVDAASEHSLDTLGGELQKQSMVIRSVLAVTRPPRGHQPPSAPTSPEPPAPDFSTKTGARNPRTHFKIEVRSLCKGVSKILTA